MKLLFVSWRLTPEYFDKYLFKLNNTTILWLNPIFVHFWLFSCWRSCRGVFILSLSCWGSARSWGESWIDTFCTFPRITQIWIYLTPSDRFLCTLRMHDVKTNGALKQVRWLVRTIGFFSLYLWFVHPPVQVTNRTICTNGKLGMKTATLKIEIRKIRFKNK